MEVVEVGFIVEGDRVTWTFPGWGKSGGGKPFAGRIVKVYGHGYSKHYGVPYLDFLSKERDEVIRRAVALPFFTHVNGRRVDRRRWTKENPELGLGQTPEKKMQKKRAFSIQLRMPLNEEDALVLKTTTRKSLDEMSESHRAHIEKWEPHVEGLGAEHVWASANRFSGRGGEGPVYVAVKRGAKDYAIVDYNTETQKKAKVLADGFESSKVLMEAFKEYRELAKEERAASKPAKATKAAPAKAAPAKAAAKKAPVKRTTAKPTATVKKAVVKKPVRSR